MVNYREVELEKIRFALDQYISSELLDSELYIDLVGDQIRACIRGFIWGESGSAHYQEIEYPRDWFQAFKARWFPAWLIKRYPIIYHKVIIDVKTIYPEFKAIVPGQKYRLLIHRNDYTVEALANMDVE